jgi:uncharacterized repeat protein (TIGR01451 family)
MLRRFFLNLVVLVGVLGLSTLLVSASMSGAIPETPAGFSCTDVTEIPQIGCEALVALYNSTDGASWSNNQGWLVTNTPCSWHRVYCVGGHVSGLHLGNNHLTGSIAPELGNLDQLQWLDLWFNSLTGSIPPELGNLGNLVDLSLANNQLSGSIPPELGNLGIGDLSLANNQLSGSIPPELGNLANLGGLYLSGNQLTGSIPPQLGNLGNLLRLRLEWNQLTGTIPPELGNLRNLDWLRLDNNQLTGSIPPELGNLSHLHWLHLDANQLTGSIPPELGELGPLWELYVNDNMLAGSLPLELITLTQLRDFYSYNTDLCEPADAAFQAWLSGIQNVSGPGEVCSLTLAKNALPSSVTAGDVLTYTLSLQNLVTDTVFSNVSLTDTLPISVTLLEGTPPASSQVGNILTWDVGSMGIGEGYTVTLRVQTPITPTQLVNQADVWAVPAAPALSDLSTFDSVTDHALYISDVFSWADFNGDYAVDVVDLTRVASCWDLPVGGMCRPSYDTNNTGYVDIGDIMRVAGAWDP